MVVKRILVAVLLLISNNGCDAFSAQQPFFASSENNNANTESTKNTNNKALQPGDTIAVIGASGNVGKLVALRLSDTYKINGVVRDASSVQPFFEGRDNINLFECNLIEEIMKNDNDFSSSSLSPALRDANAVVICTGTTAFPTEAWSKTESTSVTSAVLKALFDNGFTVKDAISDLDSMGWNTPNNVDNKSNKYVLNVWNSMGATKKRVVMLSSIGVQRRAAMPFPILNACGVLDAKAAGEEYLKQNAKEEEYSYTIIRPGQLFGGPYDNNYYLGTLFQLDKDSDTQDVEVGQGDELLGDTLRSTLAEITAQIMEKNYATNMDFAAVNVKGQAPDVTTLQSRLGAL